MISRAATISVCVCVYLLYCDTRDLFDNRVKYEEGTEVFKLQSPYELVLQNGITSRGVYIYIYIVNIFFVYNLDCQLTRVN